MTQETPQRQQEDSAPESGTTGTIHQAVRRTHLDLHPDVGDIFAAFLHNFSVTWAKRVRHRGSDFSVFLLRPLAHMAVSYGFDAEILVLYSPYDTLEPRIVLSLQDFARQDPAKGRIDPMVAFLVTEAAGHREWVADYSAKNPDGDIPIVVSFHGKRLRENKGDPYLIRNLLRDQLHQRDLFDHRLPIHDDKMFVGRDDLFYDLKNAYDLSENRGLFGLRKTGKTSLFLKLERLIRESSDDIFVYLDCKNPGIRELRWRDLLTYITKLARPGVALDTNEHPSVAFEATIRELGRKVVLVFDEIEFISPIAQQDVHWRQDFLPFWQTIWSVQSQVTHLSVLIGGVNPWCVETPEVDDVQNPLFGIVTPKYLAGMDEHEVRTLLRTLGRPMGLKFANNAVDYLVRQYGGHPLMTRLACSEVHKAISISGKSRPVEITAAFLEETERSREVAVSFYARQVVSELERFYNDEYELLAEIARGSVADLWELAKDPVFTEHLRNYGLLRVSETGRPEVSIPALIPTLQSYDRDGRRHRPLYDVVEPNDRRRWLDERKRKIKEALNTLELRIKAADGAVPSLYGPNSYPHADEFHSVPVVSGWSDFNTFINTCNKCFVEAVRAHGEQVEQKSGEHRKGVIQAYPELSRAHDRIRMYRNADVHLVRHAHVEEAVQQFLDDDLNGRPLWEVEDAPFILQQRTLDELFAGILAEIDQLS